jgi:hypothetical protein
MPLRVLAPPATELLWLNAPPPVNAKPPAAGIDTPPTTEM